MSNNLRNLFSFLLRFDKLKQKAQKIKSNPDLREKSTYFSTTSIISTLFATILILFGSYLFVSFQDSSLIILMIIIGITFIACGIILFIWAIIRLIFQFKINKNWTSWLSLVILLIGIILSIVLSIITLNSY